MSDEPTLDELLVTERTVILPGGRKAVVRQLRVRDWQGALEGYARLLGTLAIIAGEVTDAVLEEYMPGVLVEMATQGAAEDLDALLSCVCDVTAAELLDLNLADVTALWEGIHALNARPFGLRKMQLERGGFLKLLAETDVTTLASAPLSTVPESILETPNSPSPMPSPLPGRRRGGRGRGNTSAV